MIVLEITDDKFGKVMKTISEIGKHSECLEAMFEDLVEESSEYGNKMGYRNDDDDMYNSRYNMRRNRRRY